MYNYVCAISTHRRKEITPHSIKIGLTKDYNKRFPALCREVESEEKRIDCASLIPLFIIQGDYDKFTAERIEDALRLYYLNKVGYNRGYKQDWIDARDLPIQYDVVQEIIDIEELVKWFDKVGAKIIYRNLTPENSGRIYSRMYEVIRQL